MSLHCSAICTPPLFSMHGFGLVLVFALGSWVPWASRQGGSSHCICLPSYSSAAADSSLFPFLLLLSSLDCLFWSFSILALSAMIFWSLGMVHSKHQLEANSYTCCWLVSWGCLDPGGFPPDLFILVLLGKNVAVKSMPRTFLYALRRMKARRSWSLGLSQSENLPSLWHRIKLDDVKLIVTMWLSRELSFSWT